MTSQISNFLGSKAFMCAIEQFVGLLPAILRWEGVLRDEET
jgi:hypothetical protein